MKKLPILLILLLSSLLFQSEITLRRSGETRQAPDTPGQNPNGSSELAKLMRQMQQYTKDARKAVLKKGAPAAYPTAFDAIHTAKITPGTHKNEYYDSFADIYITGVKNYAAAPASDPDRIATYNNMVSGCIACHSQHCPGPVPMIRKLMIPTDN
ncbi:MAG TPA: hypothetical protein VFW78_03755 [Bacteroidia bacterium]|nr:hypothetical protein [Bacteroidia bacterium]